MSITRRCTIPECEGLFYARNVCRKHYRKMIKYGDPLYVRLPKEKEPCAYTGCAKTSKLKTLCRMHYERMLKGTDMATPSIRDPRPALITGDTAKIPIGVGAKHGYASVDIEYSWLDKYSWTKTGAGYAITDSIGYMHHCIVGKPRDKTVVDHIDRDKLNNRKSNLRLISHSYNLMNSKPKKGTSKYKGVSRVGNKWVASLYKDGSRVYCKLFNNEIEAALAYNRHAKKHFGEVAYLNELQ